MNGNGQMEVHYINTGLPYTVTESAYWSMNMSSYKFGLSGPGSSYYGPYEVNGHLPRTEVSRSVWEYPLTMNREHAFADSV